MSTASHLFEWVQGASFYRELHQAAVGLVEPRSDGGGRRWTDVGCGPGLVAGLAAARGYDVVGVDHDASMVRRARRLHPESDLLHFRTAPLSALATDSSDVVSATSLLCTLSEPANALGLLWSAVRAGGTLLIVETTPEMTRARARTVVGRLKTPRRHALMLWASARTGHLDQSILDRIDASSRVNHRLLDGMVEATVLTRSRRAAESALPPGGRTDQRSRGGSYL